MAAKKHADLSEEVEPIAAHTKLKLLGLPSNPLFPHKYRPTHPPRFTKIPNTKPARGLEKFGPFHSMHHERPQFKGTVPFWWWWSRTTKGAHNMGWYFRSTCGGEKGGRQTLAVINTEVEEERGRRLIKLQFLSKKMIKKPAVHKVRPAANEKKLLQI